MSSRRSARPAPPPARTEIKATDLGTVLARATACEAQVAERAERLNTILETIADGVAVYDAQGRPVQINRAYRELIALERGPTEVEAMTTFDRARLLDMRDAATGAPLSFAQTPAGRALRGEVVC